MKTMTRLSLLLALAACFSLPCVGWAGDVQKPNILLFLVDDMGWMDTSEPFDVAPDGTETVHPLNRRYRTPNMEALADRGVKFSNAYAHSVCTPTRASIMTGMNSARHRITNWTYPAKPKDTSRGGNKRLRSPPWRIAGINEEDIMLPRLLQKAGYRTIHCGKAHFGSNGTFGGDPLNLGFDVNIAGHAAGGPGSYHGKHNFSAAWRKGGHMWDVPSLEQYHGQDIFLTEALTLEMNKAIERAVAEGVPFFAYMSHYAVHAPFEVDDRFKGNYPDLEGRELAYATMVEGMDKSLGDLLQKLDDLNVAGNTLVVFMSDNGGTLPNNKPLRGRKGQRHEGGIRVPMIAAWARPSAEHPAQQILPIPAGRVEDDVVTCYDLFPTFAAVAGAEIARPVDGRDLRPYFMGMPGTHRPPHFLQHFPHGHNHAFFSCMREGNWKIIYNYGPETWELYNLASDLGEQTNLVKTEPALAKVMAGNMVKQLRDMKAQFPLHAETGNPVPPNLKPLDEAIKLHKQPPVGPLASDDLDLNALSRPVPEEGIFRDAEYFTWCNSIIKGEDGQYHLFYARWPKKYGFSSWLTHSEVARAVSEHASGPYLHVETVIPCRGDKPWQQITAHNPKITRFKGKYYLYFCGTNDGGRNLTEDEIIAIAQKGRSHPYWRTPLRSNQRTGVAVADSPEGPWVVSDAPVVEPAGPVSTVSVNPHVWEGMDGRYCMIFKGDHPKAGLAQALAVSDSPLGPFEVQPELVYANRRSEDTSAWWDPKRELYYGILHDMNGFGLIASEDGVRWREARHYRAADKSIARVGAKPLKPARYERPFVYTEDGVPKVLGGAVREKNGDAYIVLVPLQ